MADWREIFSTNLSSAINLYVEGDLTKLERRLDMMKELIHDEDARKELNSFLDRLNEKYQTMIDAISKSAEGTANPLDRPRIYERGDDVLDWKLKNILLFVQKLSRKYSLLPPTRG